MKYYFLIIVCILLSFSCKTINADKVVPIWFTSSTFLDDSKFIYFKAKGNTYNDAYKKIQHESLKIRSILNIVLDKEFVDSNGINYLLYKVKIKDLEAALKIKTDNILFEINKIIKNGDKSLNILEKLAFYNKALEKDFDINKLIFLSQENNIEYEIRSKKLEIENKILETKHRIIFIVEVENDINGIVKSEIINIIHNFGYKTSEIGTVTIRANLVLTDAKLNNNYINKYWSINILLEDLFSSSTKSLLLTGRDSQISEEALDNLIVRSIIKELNKSLPEILP